MRKVPEHVLAVIDEAEKFGATFTYEIRNANIAGIVWCNNQQRKVFLSKTPSDYRVPLKVRCNIRNVIREMRE